MISKNSRWQGSRLAASAGARLLGFVATALLARGVAAADKPPLGGPLAHAAKHPLACPAHVPEALNPPAEVTIDVGLAANGVQVYTCSSAKPGDAPSWTLDGPHALLSSGDHLAAIHFAGPTWQGLDGSQVKGTRLASADAPTATAVPWLLLSGSVTGAGSFAQTTHIQRLDTVGGKAPSAGCDASHAGAKVLVPYRANYFFYRTAAAGEHVRQCRSQPTNKAPANKAPASPAATSPHKS